MRKPSQPNMPRRLAGWRERLGLAGAVEWMSVCAWDCSRDGVSDTSNEAGEIPRSRVVVRDVLGVLLELARFRSFVRSLLRSFLSLLLRLLRRPSDAVREDDFPDDRLERRRLGLPSALRSARNVSSGALSVPDLEASPDEISAGSAGFKGISSGVRLGGFFTSSSVAH